MIPELEIVNLKPISQIYNTTVETCATLCTYEESVLCRSFTYYLNTGNCLLYKENLADKIYTEIKTQYNQMSNHYSRKFN